MNNNRIDYIQSNPFQHNYKPQFSSTAKRGSHISTFNPPPRPQTYVPCTWATGDLAPSHVEQDLSPSTRRHLRKLNFGLMDSSGNEPQDPYQALDRFI